MRLNYKIPLGPDDTQEPPPPFNLRTGEPEPNVFSTNDGCAYDEYSRLVYDPKTEAFDDGVQTCVSENELNFAETTEVELCADVDSGSVFEVRYYFHVVDIYYRRVRAKSPSDKEGEPLAIEEVESETNSSRSATSGLFRGYVYPGTEMNRQNITVEYTDESGNFIADSTTPTPTPTPTATPTITPTPTYVPGRVGTPTAIPTPTKNPGPPKRKIDVNFANTPARSSDTAVFYIYDNHLGTTKGCTALWLNIAGEVEANTPWNMVNGSPYPDAFSREGCEYDASTPLAIYPSARAFVDGLEYHVDPDYRSGRVSLRNDVDSGSSVAIVFHYEIVDTFPAQDKRAKVYSSSDRTGEWVAIREVSIEDGITPAASHWYRGEVVISDDEASKATGDGKVFVRNRSRLSVIYYYDRGAVKSEKRDSVGLNLPTPTPTSTPAPTPTPIPAVNPLLLVIAVGAGALTVLLWRGRVVPSGG